MPASCPPGRTTPNLQRITTLNAVRGAQHAAEPVCRLISHCSVKTHMSTKSMKRDWFGILVILLEIVIVLTAGVLAYAMFESN